MKQVNILVIILLVIGAWSCKPANDFSAVKFDKQSPDLSFLKSALKGKRIVALGESSHGFGDLQSLKSDVIKYLHSEMGYEVLMMEAGYGDVNLSWEHVSESDGRQLKNSTVFGNFRSEQLSPLFEYLKEKSESDERLEYAGFDSQVSGAAFDYKLMYVIKRLEPTIIQDSVQSGVKAYYDVFKMRDSLEAWQYYKDKVFKGVELAKSILEDNHEDILEGEMATERELYILNNTLDQLALSVDYEFGNAYTDGLAIRDSLMAVNVISQAENEFKGKKIIIWGHNGHIEKAPGEGDNIKWLGHYLREKYRDKYYALGMFAQKGAFFPHWQRKNRLFDITETDFIEFKLNQEYNSDVFVNLPDYSPNSNKWFDQNVKGFEPESGGAVVFTPTKRFDGVLQIQETKAPDLIITRD